MVEGGGMALLPLPSLRLSELSLLQTIPCSLMAGLSKSITAQMPLLITADAHVRSESNPEACSKE